MHNLFLKKIQSSLSSCYTVEQVSIAVRFVDEKKYQIREMFLQFVPVVETTGKNLAEVIECSLIKLGLNMAYLRGQGYDGAAAMKGEFRGVQAYLRGKYPLAIYTHCAAHCLNLALCDACKITPIRNFHGVATKICAFFNIPKRLAVLQNSIKEIYPEAKVTRLKSVCPTRWIERHDATILLQEMLNVIVDALSVISEWTDKETSSGALQLMNSILRSDFLVSLYVTSRIFSITLPLCRLIQKRYMDLVTALKHVSNTYEEVAAIRATAENEFESLFKKYY